MSTYRVEQHDRLTDSWLPLADLDSEPAAVLMTRDLRGSGAKVRWVEIADGLKKERLLFGRWLVVHGRVSEMGSVG